MVKDHSDSERKPATATWATLFDLVHIVWTEQYRLTTVLV